VQILLGLVRLRIFLAGINPGESYLCNLLKQSWWFPVVIPCQPNRALLVFNSEARGLEQIEMGALALCFRIYLCIIGANACQDPAEDWTDNSENRFQNEEDWDSGRIQSPENGFQSFRVLSS
jgi:hypothetical protein